MKFNQTLTVEIKSNKTRSYKQTLFQGGEVAIVTGITKSILDRTLSRSDAAALAPFLVPLTLMDDPAAAAEKAAEKKLQDILNAVNNLSDKLNGYSKILVSIGLLTNYNGSINTNVKPLIDINKTISSELLNLAQFPAPDINSENTRRMVLQEYIRTNLVLGGMQKWSSSIIGTPTTDNGLLIKWGKIINAQSAEFFDENASKQIQDQWDYLDTEQARSLRFIVDYKNTHSDLYSRAETLNDIKTWKDNRKTQMALLRGTRRAVDLSYSDIAGVATEVKTSLLNLPENTAIDKKKMVMWIKTRLRTLYEDNLGMLNSTGTGFPAGYVLSDYDNMHKAGLKIDLGLDGWTLPTDRDQIPHNPDDSSLFDGLRRLGVKITDSDMMIFDIYIKG